MVKQALSKARSKIQEEASEILGKQGGKFIPDYGYTDHLVYEQNNSGWNNISNFLNNTKIDERMNNVIKKRKIEEEVLKFLLQTPHKDMIAQNPNVLKWLVLEKSVLPRLNNKAKRK